MKRILVFDGPKAAERFRLLNSVKDMGVNALMKASERSLDDTEIQADLDDAIAALGVRFDEARAMGAVDQETLDSFEEWQEGRRLGKPDLAMFFRPRTPSGAHMLYLKPSTPAPRLVLEEGSTYKLLKRLLDKGAPLAVGALVREVRDLRKFVDAAPTSADGTLPEQAKEPIETT